MQALQALLCGHRRNTIPIVVNNQLKPVLS